jgi:hypothetical protein
LAALELSLQECAASQYLAGVGFAFTNNISDVRAEFGAPVRQLRQNIRDSRPAMHLARSSRLAI